MKLHDQKMTDWTMTHRFATTRGEKWSVIENLYFTRMIYPVAKQTKNNKLTNLTVKFRFPNSVVFVRHFQFAFFRPDVFVGRFNVLLFQRPRSLKSSLILNHDPRASE